LSEIFEFDMAADLHYDGSSWKTMKSDIPIVLLVMWESSSSDIFAVSIRGGLFN